MRYTAYTDIFSFDAWIFTSVNLGIKISLTINHITTDYGTYFDVQIFSFFFLCVTLFYRTISAPFIY